MYKNPAMLKYNCLSCHSKERSIKEFNNGDLRIIDSTYIHEKNSYGTMVGRGRVMNGKGGTCQLLKVNFRLKS